MRPIIVFSILLFLVIQNLCAQVWQDPSNDATLEIPIDFQALPFTVENLQKIPEFREYTHVILINKANSGNDRQTLKLYTNGKLALMTKVSTGRETFEAGCQAGQDPKKDHCSKRAYWSTTPVGYFDVDQLVENYFSNLWQTWMPFAVFFESGIATHQAPAGTESKLGGRASGGCVRLHPNIAPIVFQAVQQAGKGLIPIFARNGQLQKSKNGDVIRRIGFKTLVIVKNEIIN